MERFAALPGLERIEQKPQLNAGGAWTLPNGSVLVQTLSLDRLDDAGKPARKRIETRLLVRQQGEWTGYSYRWNAEQTDAELVAGRRRRRDARGGRPGRAGRPPRARPGGSRPAPSAWSATRERPASSWLHARSSSIATTITAAQSTTSSARSSTSACSRALLPQRRDDRAAAGQSLRALRARSRPGSDRTCTSIARPATSTRVAATARMELGLTTPHRADAPDRRGTRSTTASTSKTPAVVAPGSPERSVLYQRISRRGTGQMPPLGSTEVDRNAVKLIADWIRGLRPPGQ